MNLLEIADTLAANLAAAFPQLTQTERTYSPCTTIDQPGPALAVIPRSSSPRNASRAHDVTDHELAIAIYASPPADSHANLAAEILRFCRSHPTEIVPGAVLVSTTQDPALLPAWFDELNAYSTTAIFQFRTYHQR
jgi:hypothetical protein